MTSHQQIWITIDTIAHKLGLSPSALAIRSGLDSTTFNKSKRYDTFGKPHYPTTYTIMKILRANNISIFEFAEIFDSVAKQHPNE